LTAVPKIPLVDVQAQYAPLTEELRNRFEGVLESAQFIRGPNVKAFEEEAAAYLGVRRAVGVANGTDALVLVLDAMGIGPGDEVICPAFTFYATAEAIVGHWEEGAILLGLFGLSVLLLGLAALPLSVLVRVHPLRNLPRRRFELASSGIVLLLGVAMLAALSSGS
jgi:hypothetical protein